MDEKLISKLTNQILSKFRKACYETKSKEVSEKLKKFKVLDDNPSLIFNNV